MAGIGEGFTAGLEWGRRWRSDRDEKKMNQARLELEARRHSELLEAQKRTEEAARLHDFEKMARIQGFTAGEAEKNRGWQSNESNLGRGFQGSEADKDRTHRTGLQASALQSADNRDFLEKMEAERQRSHQLLLAAKVGRDPNLATVEMPLDPMNANGGKVTAKMPFDAVSGMMNKPAGDSYVSPYASQIAEAEKERSMQEIKVAGGDPDTGFLNYKNRADIITEQKKKVLQMKGLELQDKVEKGLMTREAAAAEAKRLKEAYGY